MTALYFGVNTSYASTGLGAVHTVKSGSVLWIPPHALMTSEGSTGYSITTATTDGPTNGLELTGKRHWLTEPLAAAVTISGTISIKICGYESSMSANAKFGVLIQKVSAVDFSLTTISDSVDDAEMVYSAGDNTWTTTPTSTQLAKGDRIRFVPYIDDAGTMSAGYNVYFYYNGTDTAGYDSNVSFNETLTFMTFSGSQYLYPTNTASDVSTSDVDYKIWTSRGT